MKTYYVKAKKEIITTIEEIYLIRWDGEEPMENMVTSGDYVPMSSKSTTEDSVSIEEVRTF